MGKKTYIRSSNGEELQPEPRITFNTTDFSASSASISSSSDAVRTYWKASASDAPRHVFAGSYRLPDGKGYWVKLIMRDEQLVDAVPIEVVDSGQYRNVRDADFVLQPVDLLEAGIYIFIY